MSVADAVVNCFRQDVPSQVQKGLSLRATALQGDTSLPQGQALLAVY